MTPSSVLPTPYPSPGDILDDKYRIERSLGEGGMGAVARATHLLLHRTVAVKFMNPMFLSFPGAVERFLNEGRASGAIRSEHVVPVTDVGCLPSGTPYLVMECLDGLDLADLLARDGPSLPVERAVHFVVQILRGLQAAHAIGIVHRDMKPSNCFVVTHEGEEDFVKILDFGISKITQPGSASLTQTNTALGTPLYMSPEQARRPRDVDARSDLYSVGVILYELLSGRTPYVAETDEYADLLYRLFTEDPPPIREIQPDLPEELARVVHTALAREPSHRYANALEMAEALVPFAGAKSLRIVDRMRVFKPSKQSILPAPDLPTSLAAFSQLQKSQASGAVESAPEVEVKSPFTVLLEDPAAPKAPQNTAVLPNRPEASDRRLPPAPSEPRPSSSQPEPQTVRSAGEAGLGATHLAVDPLRAGQSSAATGPEAGATQGVRDEPAADARRPRSAALVAVPILATIAVAAGVVGYVMRSEPSVVSDPNTTTTAPVSEDDPVAKGGPSSEEAPSAPQASSAASAPAELPPPEPSAPEPLAGEPSPAASASAPTAKSAPTKASTSVRATPSPRTPRTDVGRSLGATLRE